MARKKKEEDHINHEAWAIPYADMLVLLLAFFVVMYSISSVNEGKYRVLSSSLQAAFRGTPMRVQPVEFGQRQQSQADAVMDLESARQETGLTEMTEDGMLIPDELMDEFYGDADEMQVELERIADQMRDAMANLIEDDLVEVRSSEFYIEIEIKADILFPSGVAQLAPTAEPILRRVADVLAPFPNPVQVEGHTDNLPITTDRFPSNWELSAARAASVVHLFMDRGIEPMRLAVVGLGEFRPVASNETPQGRNRNRRVVLTVLADPRFQERWFTQEGAQGVDLDEIEAPLQEAMEDEATPIEPSPVDDNDPEGQP